MRTIVRCVSLVLVTSIVTPPVHGRCSFLSSLFTAICRSTALHHKVFNSHSTAQQLSDLLPLLEIIITVQVADSKRRLDSFSVSPLWDSCSLSSVTWDDL
ncbi:hypothetical protein K438DRAFT_352547 [Mycena galopus ATCC 62051]|nr:hypothetical protein K438DRAFT_352547 [Mycena galopus ATCC 62051]